MWQWWWVDGDGDGDGDGDVGDGWVRGAAGRSATVLGAVLWEPGAARRARVGATPVAAAHPISTERTELLDCNSIYII